MAEGPAPKPRSRPAQPGNRLPGTRRQPSTAEDFDPVSRWRPPQRAPEPLLLRVAAWLAITAVTLVAGIILLVAYREIAAQSASIQALPDREGPVFDEARLAELVAAGVAVAIGSPQPLRGEIVFLEPTPTPAPPRPTIAPAPRPMTCPDNPFVLPVGEICIGPDGPLPTAVPLPSCVATPVPKLLCQVRKPPDGGDG